MTKQQMDQFFNLGLPKWPQLIIVGKPVTEEQAHDIIFRTDRFLTGVGDYWGGNNKTFNERYQRESGLSLIDEAGKALPNPKFSWRFESDCQDLIRRKVGYIDDREYIHNSWASCSYVYGPYGFCSPDGEIYYGDNVGKWPSVENIYDELCLIAKAFPYLDLKACLYNKEHSEENREAVVTFIVQYGEVTMTLEHDDELPKYHEVYASNFRTDAAMIRRLTGPNSVENGLKYSQLLKYQRTLKEMIPAIIEEVKTWPQYQEGYDPKAKQDGA